MSIEEYISRRKLHQVFAAIFLVMIIVGCKPGKETPLTLAYTFLPSNTPHIQIITATLTATSTKTETPTFTPVIGDVFNESTWPKEFQGFWNGGWLNATDTERLKFQTFIENSRAAFFAKEGFTDEVEKLMNIRPVLRSLWGMIYWVETHIDEVIQNMRGIVITPNELLWIITDPTMVQETWGMNPIEINGVRYYIEAYPGYYSTDLIGAPIVGKDDVTIPRGPYWGIIGDLGALGYIGGGDSRVDLLLVNVLDKKGFRHLAAPSVSFDENKVFPKGTPCLAKVSNLPPVVRLPQDVKIGQLRDRKGKKYTADDLRQLLGRHIGIDTTFTDYLRPLTMEISYAILEPKSNIEFYPFIGTSAAVESNNWPWVDLPTATPSPTIT